MKITENDIATIEQMHDLVLNEGLMTIYNQRSISARDLISRMHKAHQIQQKESDINNLVKKSKYLEKKHGLKITLTFE